MSEPVDARSPAVLRATVSLGAPLLWLRGWGPRVEQLLAARLASVLMLAAVAAAYVYQYLRHPSRPGGGAPGWWSWQDQSFYRSTAQALADLSTDPTPYKVSLGYPLLAVPFEAVFSEHLFFVPDLLMVLGISIAFYRIGRLFLSRRDTVLMFVLVALWTKAELVTALVIPWTTIPTHLVAYAMIYLYLSRAPSWRLVVALTALDGFAYLCRPGDGAFLAPLVVAAVVQLPGSWKRKVSVAAAGMGLVLAFVAFDRLVNMAVFERALSSYERGALDDFFGFSVLQRAYMLFVDGEPVNRTQEPMIVQRLGYLLLIGPGAWFAVRRLKWAAIAPIACTVLCLALYLNYNYFRPAALFKFNLVHYITWMFPLAGLLAYLTIRRAWETTGTRTFAVLVAVPLFVYAFVRLEERPGGVARVGTDGRLTLISASADEDAEYDLLIGRDANGRKPWIRARGSRVEAASQGPVQILHAADARRVKEFRAPHAAEIGATLELRRLRWRLAPMPAWLERNGGAVTVPAPILPIRADLGSWRGFATQAGRVDRKEASLRTDGPPGMLEHRGLRKLARGRYVVEWLGKVDAGGRVIASVEGREGGETLARAVTDLERGQDSLLVSLEFRVVEAEDDVEFRLYTFEGVELGLHRVVTWRYRDWAMAAR